ncbi:hypothetical protein CBR_g256 [Chara braunii]|uniref:Integrase zinc-binding domain-containing protein n=1 Tax=Chara braunii TaxID=69332 RepID=A0A388JM30_CHABU|nr:hypothetical protein CBR_g256 [Chara braunii]|eukprot:GBG58857.1 hypothetical protein CBR_g256 [Chara braunii]
MSDREEQQPDDRILRSARRPVAHLALGLEDDRHLFRQLRERQQQQRRARAAEPSRALVSEAAASEAMATAAQQSTQAGSSRSVGSMVAQTQSQSTGVMASQPLVLTPNEIAIQQAAIQEAQLQKALGEIKVEKDRMIKRRARMQHRQADVSELEEMDLTNVTDDVRLVRSLLLNVVEMTDDVRLKLAKSTYEKKLYAVYKALTHWTHYLLGRFFILRTDHQTLRWMRTQPVLSDALKRWIEVIQQGVDALSHRPDFLGALITEFDLTDSVTQSLVEAYREDQFMSEIIRRLEAKDKKTSAVFEMVNGLLFLEKEGNKRLCVPNSESLRSLFLGECHDATGHFGYKKTAANLLQRFWWPTMMQDAQLYVETFQVCQRDKPRTQAPLGLLKPLPIPERPGESLSMDFMDTLITSKSGMRHIFVIVDRFKFAYRNEQRMQQAVEQMQKAQAAMIEFENRHRRPSTFQVGDRVWVKSSELGQEYGISRKLMPQYFGPWEVLDIVGTDPDGPSYVIRIPGHLRTYPVFHASKLAPFKETDQFPSRRSMLPPTMDGEVDIDDIVDHTELQLSRPTGRGRPPKSKLQYLVRFQLHTDPKEDRWFTRDELMQTAPQVVAHYEKSLQKGKRPMVED